MAGKSTSNSPPDETTSQKRGKTSGELRAEAARKGNVSAKPYGRLVPVHAASQVRSITVEQWARSKSEPTVRAFMVVQGDKTEKLPPAEWQKRYQAFLKEPRK